MSDSLGANISVKRSLSFGSQRRGIWALTDVTATHSKNFFKKLWVALAAALSQPQVMLDYTFDDRLI